MWWRGVSIFEVHWFWRRLHVTVARLVVFFSSICRSIVIALSIVWVPDFFSPLFLLTRVLNIGFVRFMDVAFLLIVPLAVFLALFHFSSLITMLWCQIKCYKLSCWCRLYRISTDSDWPFGIPWRTSTLSLALLCMLFSSRVCLCVCLCSCVCVCVRVRVWNHKYVVVGRKNRHFIQPKIRTFASFVWPDVFPIQSERIWSE